MRPPSSAPCPVTVVIPCFNAKATIRRAVAAVAAQTAPAAALIVVDDASTDGTADALRGSHTDHGEWLRVVTLDANGGVAGARNAGWELARTPWVAFLDADDVWHPRKLELQSAWMRAHPEVVLTGHAWSRALGDVPSAPRARRVSLARLLFSNPIRPSSPMVRTDAPHRFDPTLRRGEDYDLWLRLAADGCPIAVLDAPLVMVEGRQWLGDGLSADLAGMERAELATFSRLRAARRIGAASHALAVMWSLARFARRWVVALASANSGKIRQSGER